MSETLNHATYEVQKVMENDDCGSCKLRFEACNICIHAYTCTCSNNLIYSNICKHIHASRQYMSERTEKMENDTSEPFTSPLQQNYYILPINSLVKMNPVIKRKK